MNPSYKLTKNWFAFVFLVFKKSHGKFLKLNKYFRKINSKFFLPLHRHHPRSSSSRVALITAFVSSTPTVTNHPVLTSSSIFNWTELSNLHHCVTVEKSTVFIPHASEEWISNSDLPHNNLMWLFTNCSIRSMQC